MKAKRKGSALDIKVFKGKDGRAYLVFRTLEGSFHSFAEVEADEAAIQCGAAPKGNTRRKWSVLWDD